MLILIDVEYGDKYLNLGVVLDCGCAIGIVGQLDLVHTILVSLHRVARWVPVVYSESVWFASKISLPIIILTYCNNHWIILTEVAKQVGANGVRCPFTVRDAGLGDLEAKYLVASAELLVSALECDFVLPRLVLRVPFFPTGTTNKTTILIRTSSMAFF